MDLTQLMVSRIDLMLEAVGPGMKVLLMDPDTTTSVSIGCPQSQVQYILLGQKHKKDESDLYYFFLRL